MADKAKENPTEEVVEDHAPPQDTNVPASMAEAADQATVEAQTDAGKLLLADLKVHESELKKIIEQFAELQKQGKGHQEELNKIRDSMLNLGTIRSERVGAIKGLVTAIRKLEASNNG